jgi:hypothetical protein
MRHANVRNAGEVEVREMIKGRHNMRLRQLGKPAGSIALGATLTEVAPGGISFPAMPITSTKKRSMSSPVPERRESAMHASLCGRGTGSRCRPAPSTRIRWSTSRPPNRSSISVSRRCAGQRLLSIPIPAKSGPVSPTRQARWASAALACFGPAAARSITGTVNPRRAEFCRARHSSGDGANPVCTRGLNTPNPGYAHRLSYRSHGNSLGVANRLGCRDRSSLDKAIDQPAEGRHRGCLTGLHCESQTGKRSLWGRRARPFWRSLAVRS